MNLRIQGEKMKKTTLLPLLVGIFMFTLLTGCAQKEPSTGKYEAVPKSDLRFKLEKDRGKGQYVISKISNWSGDIKDTKFASNPYMRGVSLFSEQSGNVGVYDLDYYGDRKGNLCTYFVFVVGDPCKEGEFLTTEIWPVSALTVFILGINIRESVFDYSKYENALDEALHNVPINRVDLTKKYLTYIETVDKYNNELKEIVAEAMKKYFNSNIALNITQIDHSGLANNKMEQANSFFAIQKNAVNYNPLSKLVVIDDPENYEEYFKRAMLQAANE